MLNSFPLLAFGLLVYGVLTLADVVTGGGSSGHWQEIAVLPDLTVVSGDLWRVKAGDVFLIACMGLLFVELVRATQTTKAALTNHIFSFFLFVASLLCFILVKGFGNSVFFIFMTMTLLDPMAGIIVSNTAARRDISITDKNLGVP